MSKKTDLKLNNDEKKQPEKKVAKPKYIQFLRYDIGMNLFVPINWKYPYHLERKNYLAVILGISERFEFDRAFLDKKKILVDEEDEKRIDIGYPKEYFKEGLIIEEQYKEKRDNTFITKTNFYEVSLFEEGVWGTKLSKRSVREKVIKKQMVLFERFEEIINDFGQEFTIFSLESLIKRIKIISKPL